MNYQKELKYRLKQPKEDTLSLHKCAENNNVRLARRLIDFGAKINEEDHQGDTPLVIAIIHQNNEIAEFFIEEGADIEKTTRISGSSPLHLSILYNNEEVFYLLIHARASLKTSDRQGQTALHLAAELGREKMVTELIGVGARTSVKEFSEKIRLYTLQVNLAKKI